MIGCRRRAADDVFNIIWQNSMDGGKYGRPDTYAGEDTVKVGIFDGLEIGLERVFRV